MPTLALLQQLVLSQTKLIYLVVPFSVVLLTDSLVRFPQWDRDIESDRMLDGRRIFLR